MAGQEIEVDVVERVFDDLVRRRLDPQRHEGHLVQDAAKHLFLALVLFLIFLAAAAVSAPALDVLPLGRLIQLGRVVLDAQDLLAFELLAADERVGARIEL